MGKPWTHSEDQLLKDLLLSNTPYTEISLKLNRTRQSVVTRYYKKFITTIPRKTPQRLINEHTRDFSKGDLLKPIVEIEGEILAEAKRRHGTNLTIKYGGYFLFGKPVSVTEVIILSGLQYGNLYERIKWI